MKVCIGITTKNRADILPKALDSALSQSYSDLEVCVFNDGSDDHTSSLQEKYPNVKWMESPTSLGLLGARNEIMNSTDADIYVTLDDDAWFLEGDEIEIAVSHMKADSKLAVVAFDILQRETPRFNKVEREPAISTNTFVGCGAMVRLSAVREVGSFVPFPVRYGHEEKDLSIRLIDHGYRLLFLPGVHVWHDYTSVGRNLEDQRKSFIINDLVYQYRRVPLVYLYPVLINNMLRKLSSDEDPTSLSSKGIFSFFKLIPTQKDKIQRVRRSSYRKYRSISKSFLSYIHKNNQEEKEPKPLVNV